MDWLAAEAFTDEVCADVFDRTTCRLQPRAKGLTNNHADGDDPNRATFDFLGTVELESPADRITRHLSSDPGIRNGTVSYDAVLTALVNEWPYPVQKGDLVLEGGRRWRIVADERDGSRRCAYYLSKA